MNFVLPMPLCFSSESVVVMYLHIFTVNTVKRKQYIANKTPMPSISLHLWAVLFLFLLILVVSPHDAKVHHSETACWLAWFQGQACASGLLQVMYCCRTAWTSWLWIIQRSVHTCTEWLVGACMVAYRLLVYMGTTMLLVGSPASPAQACWCELTTN